jgi:eukaryotic-like serine/threonine-protein kinase
MSELLFGRFAVEDRLGKGSAAEVYKVRNVKSNERFALKVLSAEDDETAERTYREGQIQKQLKHPNIARVHEVFLNRRDVGLVMELVDGPSLDEVLLAGHRFTLDEALQFFQQLLSGMESAHKAGVIHRDLKPSNVLIYDSVREDQPAGTSGGGGIQAKIIDFGQGRAEQEMGPRMTVMGAQLGTAGYAAPEQLTDARGAGVPADIFSLGTILYELVCGRPAFYQKDNNFAAYRATLEGKYARVDDVLPDCPMHVASAITRALEYDPGARFQSCSEFALALYGEQLHERPPATPVRTRSAHIATPSNLGRSAQVLDALPERSVVPQTAQTADDGAKITALIWIVGIAVAVLVLGLLFLLVAAWLWMRLGA